jgi:uncharacterized membrane protein YeiH
MSERDFHCGRSNHNDYCLNWTLVCHSVGVGPLAAIVMGVLTAAMGGVIRDILAHQPSAIIGPEIYITAAALAAAVTVGLMLAGLSAPLAGGIGALAGFGLRAGALAKGWELPHYRKS